MKTNDTKLTAYALNELPETERQAFEKELTPETRKAVEEIRALAGQLNAHYATEGETCLTDEQRETIFAAARKKKEKIIPFPRYVWMPLASAAALAGIILYVSLPRISGPTDRAVEVAGRMESTATPTDKRIRTDVDPFSSTPSVTRPKMELKKPAIKMKKSAKPKTLRRIARGRPYGKRSDAGAVSLYMSADKFEKTDCYGVTRTDSLTARPWGPSIENYAEIRENQFLRVINQPLSTFSIDVDTASYSNMRRFLKNGTLPPKDAIRIEELINYFDYNDAPPTGNTPFATHLEVSSTPWNPKHKLVRIALKGFEIEQSERPALNLVFLLDVSGSMNSENKLPLVKRAMTMLTRQLDERDRVSIVVYAGASGLVLPPTFGANRQAILDALKRLEAGGGTNGGQGIELAYRTALENYNKEGVNRVILCTDGDFNIGVTQGGDLNRLIEEKAKSGIFLSVLGFGTGNTKDSIMEQLADRGNGNYAYIDTFSEARKVLVDEMSGTLLTIAKDVKIQVEFNPALVAGYRLIGYENRMLKTEDFNDDKKDAGEIGAGHTVTALYEIVPTGQPVNGIPPVDELKYQISDSAPVRSDELLTVKLRYKEPDGDTSRKIEIPLRNVERSFESTSDDFRFATAVAGFGMLLRDSEFKGDLTYGQVIEWAQSAQGEDGFGYRREFIELVRNAQAIGR